MVMEENTEKQTVARESCIPLTRIVELGPVKSGKAIISKWSLFIELLYIICVNHRIIKVDERL